MAHRPDVVGHLGRQSSQVFLEVRHHDIRQEDCQRQNKTRRPAQNREVEQGLGHHEACQEGFLAGLGELVPLKSGQMAERVQFMVDEVEGMSLAVTATVGLDEFHKSKVHEAVFAQVGDGQVDPVEVADQDEQHFDPRADLSKSGSGTCSHGHRFGRAKGQDLDQVRLGDVLPRLHFN
jgi:hypothetical protein